MLGAPLLHLPGRDLIPSNIIYIKMWLPLNSHPMLVGVSSVCGKAVPSIQSGKAGATSTSSTLLQCNMIILNSIDHVIYFHLDAF